MINKETPSKELVMNNKKDMLFGEKWTWNIEVNGDDCRRLFNSVAEQIKNKEGKKGQKEFVKWVEQYMLDSFHELMDEFGEYDTYDEYLSCQASNRSTLKVKE